jgi:hypothetical protein
LYLDDDFNCLELGDTLAMASHLFNILHGVMCVAVLFATRLESANICWGFVLSQMALISFVCFSFVFSLRFPDGEKNTHFIASKSRFGIFVCFGVFGVFMAIHRYYEITNIIQKRTARVTSSIYGGRLLNEQIIYQNESSFLQKKFILRQAMAHQIFGVVQKVQEMKDSSGRVATKEQILNHVQIAVDNLYGKKTNLLQLDWNPG